MMVTFTAWVSRGDQKEKKKSYFGFKQSIHHIVGIEEKKKSSDDVIYKRPFFLHRHVVLVSKLRKLDTTA